MVDFKTVFIEQIEPAIRSGEIKSICDLGSGKSQNFIELLRRYPHLRYTGVEPSLVATEIARESLAEFKNAKVYNSDGYSPVGDEWGKFDLVISLSVLEHVKQIDRFLKNSIAAASPGGQVVHRWDLGHAIYPSSLKERLQVWLGNNLPNLLPEHKFVSKLMPSEVIRILESGGVIIESVTYHQMPGHKKFLKQFTQDSEEDAELVKELIMWEMKVSNRLGKMEENIKLKLFPTIAVWTRKTF
jgi:2-polyprenyl-3-methyl-5-hydroxy-6-metoxy-1,4-benzoquinol methylase